MFGQQQVVQVAFQRPRHPAVQKAPVHLRQLAVQRVPEQVVGKRLAAQQATFCGLRQGGADLPLGEFQHTGQPRGRQGATQHARHVQHPAVLGTQASDPAQRQFRERGRWAQRFELPGVQLPNIQLANIQRSGVGFGRLRPCGRTVLARPQPLQHEQRIAAAAAVQPVEERPRCPGQYSRPGQSGSFLHRRGGPRQLHDLRFRQRPQRHDLQVGAQRAERLPKGLAHLTGPERPLDPRATLGQEAQPFEGARVSPLKVVDDQRLCRAPGACGLENTDGAPEGLEQPHPVRVVVRLLP